MSERYKFVEDEFPESLREKMNKVGEDYRLVTVLDAHASGPDNRFGRFIAVFERRTGKTDDSGEDLKEEVVVKGPGVSKVESG